MSPPDTPPDGDASDWSGRILRERYRVESVLGVGGMGTAFKAFDLKLERAVVLKVPHARHVAADESRGRFQEEIRKLIAIEHPHVVKVFDVDDEDVAPFAVFPFLAGGNLSARMKASGGPLPAEAVVPWLTQIADALDDLHERGDLHRDVKPDNILFDKPFGKGRANAYLADFGLAKALGLDPARLFQSRTGTLIGTQAYMAPEQFTQQGSVTGAVDQYALATTVYQALSGEMPFTVSTAEELAVAKAMRSPRPLWTVAKGVPPGVDRAVMRALSAAPEARFRTCGDFAREFGAAAGAAVSAAVPAPAARGGQAPGARPASPPAASPTPARVAPVPLAPGGRDPVAAPRPADAVPLRPGRRARWIAAVLVIVGGLGGAGLLLGWFRTGDPADRVDAGRGAVAAAPVSEPPSAMDVPRPTAPPPAEPPAPAPVPAPQAPEAPSPSAVAMAEAKALAEGGDWEGLRAKLSELARLTSGRPDVPKEWLEGLKTWDAPPEVAIERPIEGETVEEPGVELRGTFRSFRTFDVLKVNGSPVAAPGGRFAVTVPLKAEGEHAFTVTVEFQGAQRLVPPRVLHVTYAAKWRRPLAEAVAAGTASDWETAKRALAEALALGAPSEAVPASLTEGIAQWDATPVFVIESPNDRGEWVGRALRVRGTLTPAKVGYSVAVEGLEGAEPAQLEFEGGRFDLKATLGEEVGERELRFVAKDADGKQVGDAKSVRFTVVSLLKWVKAALEDEAEEESARKLRVAVEYVEANPAAPDVAFRWQSVGDAVLREAFESATWPRWLRLGVSLEATAGDSDLRFELQLVRAAAEFRLGRSGASEVFERVVEVARRSDTAKGSDASKGAGRRLDRLVNLISFLREECDDAPSANAAYRIGLTAHPEWMEPEKAPFAGLMPLLGKPLAPFPKELVDLEGKPVALSDYAGKVLLLYFAHACSGPCFGQQQSLNRFYADVQWAGLEVLGIDGYEFEGDERLRKYLDGISFPWRQVAHGAAREEVVKRYVRGSLPFWILLGRDQQVVEFGGANRTHLTRSVSRALGGVDSPPEWPAPRPVLTTPNLILMQLEEARARAAKVGLKLKVSFRGAEESWIPKGVVAKQTPKPGDPLPLGKTLDVVISGFEDGVSGRPVPDWARVSEEQVAEAKRLGIPVALENSIGMRFLLVPAGTFTMGSPEGEKGRDADETPHAVTLTQAYYVAIHETTNGEFRRFKKDHDSGTFKGVPLNDDEQPVVSVRHADAVEFAAWLTGQESGRGYRLPTEAEWEYAARATTTTSRPWEDRELLRRHANVADQAAKAKFGTEGASDWDDRAAAAAPVGRFQPNGWGLYDTMGNVWELCSDWMADYPPGTAKDPVGPASGAARVLRGGSWTSTADFARSAERGKMLIGAAHVDAGFRLVVPARAAR